MTQLIVLFAVVILWLGVEFGIGVDDDELADDADRRDWIDFLARESRKGHRTSRSRYARSGIHH